MRAKEPADPSDKARASTGALSRGTSAAARAGEGAAPDAELVLAAAGEQAPLSVRAVRTPTPPPPSTRARRTRRTLWVLVSGVVAAAVLVAIAVLVVAPLIESMGGAGKQTPAQIAAAVLRDQALPACASARWPLCQAKLDEAAKLDPASESDGRVERMREDIRAHATANAPAP